MRQLPNVVMDTIKHFCTDSVEYGGHPIRYDDMNAKTLRKYLPKCFSIKKVKTSDNRPYQVTLRDGGKIPSDIVINIVKEERDNAINYSDRLYMRIRHIVEEF